jgi:hypothetical protein
MAMDEPPEIQHVLLFSAAGGGLLLAECADGSLRLFQSERPLEGCRWENHQVDEAAAEFRRRAAELNPDLPS